MAPGRIVLLGSVGLYSLLQGFWPSSHVWQAVNTEPAALLAGITPRFDIQYPMSGLGGLMTPFTACISPRANVSPTLGNFIQIGLEGGTGLVTDTVAWGLLPLFTTVVGVDIGTDPTEADAGCCTRWIDGSNAHTRIAAPVNTASQASRALLGRSMTPAPHQQNQPSREYQQYCDRAYYDA